MRTYPFTDNHSMSGCGKIKTIWGVKEMDLWAVFIMKKLIWFYITMDQLGPREEKAESTFAARAVLYCKNILYHMERTA